MWVKICGITTLEDARMAVDVGADALGFVLAESPRRVTPESVREMTLSLPSAVERIGVFVDATLEFMVSAIEIAGLTGVQLHGEGASSTAQELRERTQNLSGSLRIVHVLHYGKNDDFVRSLRALAANPAVETVLVDTCMAGRRGGTGVAFDWAAARDSFIEQAPHVRLIAAGGLSPDNVEHAIQTLQPWGVDVSSGVEWAPGRKDPQRVKAFLQAARATVAMRETLA